MDQERKTTGCRNRDKYTLAAIAAAGLIGVVAGGNGFGESPRPHPNKAAATELEPLSVKDQLIGIKSRIEDLKAAGVTGVWLEKAGDELIYTASVSRKNDAGKSVYDQLILIMHGKSMAPDRVLITVGANKPNYQPGTTAEFWAEIDKQTSGDYTTVMGYDTKTNSRTGGQTRSAVEGFMYDAEYLLEIVENSDAQPGLEA